MKITIRINEDTIKYLHDTYCATQPECVTCCCSVDIGEDYVNCIDKYMNIFLKDEIEKKANEV